MATVQKMKEQRAADIRRTMLKLQELIDDAVDNAEMRFVFDVKTYRGDNQNHPILELNITADL